ncbi:MAG: hypothetical protein C4320_02035 [Armatimonadota bacterium]
MRLPLLLLLALATLAAAQKTAETSTVADLLKDGTKFDKKVVRVTGKVQNLQEKQSRAKNDYFTFELLDETKTINVFGFGKVKGLKDGVKVEATGRFDVLKKMPSFEVKNQLDVSIPRKRDGSTETTQTAPEIKFGIKILS